MPTLTIDVPAAHRDALLRELLILYAVKADALHHAVGAYLDDERSPASLLAHRGELTEVDALVEQLGWRLHQARTPARLSGNAQLLAEITRGALSEALEDMTQALCDADESGAEIEAVGRALRRVSALYELIEHAYRPAGEDAT